MTTNYMFTTEESGKRGLLNEYIKVLTGEVANFSPYTLGKKSLSSRHNAIIICKLAFEIFLRWTPDDVAHRLTYEIIRDLKLETVIPHLDLPDDFFNGGDYTLLASEIYPGRLNIDERTLVINTYKMVLRGKKKGGLYRFPKKYFDGNIGLKRAHICFQYMLSNHPYFHDKKEMYEFFSTQEGIRLINSQGLKLVLRDIFISPVRFLHESLPPEERDEYWYHFYNFLYWYAKDKKMYDQCQKIYDTLESSND